MKHLASLLALILLIAWSPPGSFASDTNRARTADGVPILLYHRFDTRPANSMTVTTEVFESQLAYLRNSGYHVITLRRLVDWLRGTAPAPPPKSVVIVADDGHGSIYTHMLPLVKKYNVPVTLFIYPSAISNAAYAMTWDQLTALKKTGLFDIQSHSYWHPNFRKERKKMSREEYLEFVDFQLEKSRKKLEAKLGGRVDMLAWPFGELPDPELVERAKKAGYSAAFTIVRRAAGPSDPLFMLPRFLILNSDRGKPFETIINPAPPGNLPECPHPPAKNPLQRQPR